MADPADIGGKFWTDLGGVDEAFVAANMNRLRPHAHVRKSAALEITVGPARWFNDSDFLTFPGHAVSVPSNTTTFVYLDGTEASGDTAQLKTTTIAFPSPTTKGFFYLAEVVTNSTEIVSITNVNMRRPVAGSGVLQDINVVSPLQKGGTTTVPEVSIPAAASGQNGYMSGADKDKLDALSYPNPGVILQGANPGPGPAQLAIGPALSRLRVNAGGTALEYVSDPFPPSFYAERDVATSNNQTSPTLVEGMTLTPPAGTYLAAWGSSAFMSGSGSAFMSIFSGGTFQPGSERVINQTLLVPFLCFARVTVNGSQAIEGRAVVGGAGQQVNFQKRNIIAFRISP